MRRLLIISLLCLFTPSACAIEAAPPATCVTNSGYYEVTTGVVNYWVCTSTDTWTPVVNTSIFSVSNAAPKFVPLVLLALTTAGQNGVTLATGSDGLMSISPIASNGVHLTFGQDAATTCTANCGTDSELEGNDAVGHLTMGGSGSPASGFVVTFASTWPNAPQCHVWSSKAGMAVGKSPIVVATTVSTFTVTTNGTAPGNSDTYDYHCFGY